MEQITLENYKNVNIKSLTLNPEFGSLAFENAWRKLEKIQQWFSDFENLDYSKELPQSILDQINSHLLQFIEILNWLKAFNIATSPNAKEEHDNFENRVDVFYNSVYTTLVVNHLNFLKQIVSERSKDKKNLNREQLELANLRKEYAQLVLEAKAQRNKVVHETEKIVSAKKQRGAARFGKFFELQSQENSAEAEKWLKWRNWFFYALLIVIILNVFGYFILFVLNKVNEDLIKPVEFFTIEYGLLKLALLSLLSYAIAFCSRNYNVNSNLVSLNKHRKNIAETLSDFLDAEMEDEDRTKLVANATDAMFKHQPIGYLPKIESKDDGPVPSVINNILRQA